ncbi:glutathione transferase [Aureococcus anophagefferens]|nr:glutathione transferase [Aureococcus anophagefferens]
MRVLLAALIGSARGLPTAAPTESLGGCPFLTSNNDYFGASRCDEASYDEEWDEASEYEHECYMHEWIASSCAELRCDPESERLWLTKRHVHDMHRENSNNWWSWRTDACMVLSPDGRFYRATTGYEATREEGWMDKGSYRDSTDVDASGLAGLNATDASVLAWGRRAYAACVEQCGGCDATGAAVDRVPAGLDAFFAAPYPAVDRPALDDAGCFSARALRGEDWPFVSTGHWVVICVMALVLATPWVLGVCASRRCCPWYGSLQRVRNEFADACPCLARCLRLLCVSGCASCARCCGACRRRVRGCVRAPPRKASADVAPEEDDAAAAAGEAPADDVARLVLWKIWKTKSRSPSTVLSQLVFPAAWFVVVWLLYVIMAKTFLPNHQWNKKHWNYAAKGGDMRDYEEGDILSHGLLEVYLCQFAFVPLMQAVVVAVVVEHRAKLVESMKMAGLRPLAYWAATFAAEALAVGFACAFLVACVACGGLFRRAGHAADPFGTLLALHWTYVVALAAQCFAVTTLVTSPTAAAVYALAAQLAATGAYQSLVVETTDAGKRVVLSLFEASESRQLVAALLPQFAYALVVGGFRSHRTLMCDLGAGLGAETFRSPAFECDDDKAEARAGPYGGGAYEASSSSSSYAYGADASSSYAYAYAADAYAYEPLDRCERTRAPSEYPPFYARDAPFYGDGPRPAPRSCRGPRTGRRGGGPVASAVAPIFDKRADPWTFLGVAAADVPLCELEALSGYTDDGGDVAANPTQQGCACEEGSYEYDGRTFEGCTSYDWSVPWCGTTNCGICDDLVSTGCWDECEDSGTVRGKMEAYLRGRSSAVCAGRIAAFTDGAIELTAAATNALRESFPCPVGTAAAEDDEWISALTVANPFSVGADWRDDESSYDAQTLGRESSCGSLYEMQPCDSCDAALTPTLEGKVDPERREPERARARVAPQQVATPEQVATAQVAKVPVAVPVEAPAIWGDVVNS